MPPILQSFVICFFVFFTLLGCQSIPDAKLDFTDGSYEGEINRDGLKHGTGVYRWLDGSIYEGSYQNDLRDGEGRFLWANGESYTGQYIKDIRTGKGLYSWPDGSFYEGDFLSGKRHGKGKYTSADGSTYEGEWFDDLQHGEGILIHKDGRTQRGVWRKGILLTKPAALPEISQQPNLPNLQLPEPTKPAPVHSSEPVEPAPLSSSTQLHSPEISSLGSPQSDSEVPSAKSPVDTVKEEQSPTPSSTEDFSEETSEPALSNSPSEEPIEQPAENDTEKKHQDLGPADWIGTLAEVEASFTTELIDGFDTVCDRANGTPFTGSMRVVDREGRAKGEVNLLHGRLHGEEIFYNDKGEVIKKNFWSNGNALSK